MNDQQRYNRERKAMNLWINRDKEFEVAMEFMHREAIARIQNRIDQYYTNYASREGISIREAKKRASDMDVRAWRQRAAEAVRDKDFSDEANAWLKVYNLKQKVSRLELIKAEVNLDLLELYSKQERFIESSLVEDMQTEINRQQKIIEESYPQTGVLNISSTYDKRSVEGIVRGDFYGATFSERIWGRNGHYDSIRKEVFKSLARMNVDMDGYRKERNRLMKKFETSKYEAMRLIKTESARVRGETQLKMLKDNGFTHLVYVAEPDACSICSSLDGTEIPIDEVEMGLNLYPMHPNCKCSAYGKIKFDKMDEMGSNSELEDAIMRSSGAVYGAWNDQNDPMRYKRDGHANRFYESVRNRDKDREVTVIARNTGFREKDIEQVYDHIFVNEHLFKDGTIKRFDSDYDMANSWARLREGKDIKPHDITMLEHEMYELIVMNNDQTYYEKAHAEAQSVYNYKKEVDEFNDYIGQK